MKAAHLDLSQAVLVLRLIMSVGYQTEAYLSSGSVMGFEYSVLRTTGNRYTATSYLGLATGGGWGSKGIEPVAPHLRIPRDGGDGTLAQHATSSRIILPIDT